MQTDSTYLLTYRSHSHLPVANWATSTVAYPINMSLVVHVTVAATIMPGTSESQQSI